MRRTVLTIQVIALIVAGALIGLWLSPRGEAPSPQPGQGFRFQSSWQEPYGGCDEAANYRWTPGWRQCVRHGRLEVGIRPCIGEIGRATCVWDARHAGNGHGQSVVLVRNGVVDVGHDLAHTLVNNWFTIQF